MTDKIVGILGGMGPEATVDLMARVIRSTPAADDIDHVRLVVDNNPQVPSRIKALIEKTGQDPVPCLQEMARKLAAWGVDLLAMPCNTAHWYHRQVQSVVDIPLLNMVELSAQAVAAGYPDARLVGLMASTAVLDLRLYDGALAKEGIRPVTPDAGIQDGIMQAIRSLKTGHCGQEELRAMQAAAANLEGKGADVLLVACTELSIIAARLEPDEPCLDTAQILAEEIVRRAKGLPQA